MSRKLINVLAPGALLGLVVVAAWGPTGGPPVATPGPLLIKHGWDIPSPVFVRDHAAAMDRLPFDGLTITLPDLSHQVQRQTPVDRGRFEASLAPLDSARLVSLTHNFAMAYAAPAGSFFDDYSVPVENFANLAAAARGAGLEGIAYDNEEYFGPAARYPENCSGRTVDQCRERARLRGRQTMDAMRRVWPDVRVLVFLGPWVSEPKTADVLGAAMNYNDVAWANQVMGSFVVGMVESTVGSKAQVVDAGELYTLRTKSEFAVFRSWQKHGLARSSSLIPHTLRPVWSRTISAGAMVYDRPWIEVGMDDDTWRRTIHNALASVDDYVVAYTERHDWWGKGWPLEPVPRSWVEATRRAQQAPSADAPLVEDMSWGDR